MAESLLIELLTEELPPKALKTLGEVLADRILYGLVKTNLKLRESARRCECHYTKRIPELQVRLDQAVEDPIGKNLSERLERFWRQFLGQQLDQ